MALVGTQDQKPNSGDPQPRFRIENSASNDSIGSRKLQYLFLVGNARESHF